MTTKLSLPVVCLFLCVFIEGECQNINFEENLSWQQTKQKAQANGKYIFVDCYATWCGPCKAMDKSVFTEPKVVKFLDSNFISLKLQMDRTVSDNESIKRWRREAERFQQDYDVTAYPTYLFFDSEGKAVHKIVGLMNVEKFLSEAGNALDPEKQYYAILSKYERGLLDTIQLKSLAREYSSSGSELPGKLVAAYLKKLPEVDFARKDVLELMVKYRLNPVVQEFAARYLQKLPTDQYESPDNSFFLMFFEKSEPVQKVLLNYLDGLNNNDLKGRMSMLQRLADVQKAKEIGSRYLGQLPKDELYTADNLLLLADFTKGINEPGFEIFYNESSGRKAEAIIRQKKGHENDRARDFANTIFIKGDLSRDYFGSKDKENFDWNALARKYKGRLKPAFIRENILNARVQALAMLIKTNEKFWPDYIKYNIQFLDTYGWDTTNAFVEANFVNNFAFSGIFFHSTDKVQLETAIRWMAGIVRRNPHANLIDTYANLLYKVGRKVQAIAWQTRAIDLALKIEDQNYLIPSLEANLKKMKNNEPTWLVIDQ